MTRYGVAPPFTVTAPTVFRGRESRPPRVLYSSNVMRITPTGLAAPFMGAYQLAPSRAEPGCRVLTRWRSVNAVMLKA
jgi:hypothetical protein